MYIFSFIFEISCVEVMPTYLHIVYQPRPLRTTVASFLTLNGISTVGLRNHSSRHMLRHHRNNNHRHHNHNICPFKNEKSI